MAKRPWYPWFPADYERDTRLLSLEADGLYRRLLDACWEMGSLPRDLRDLSKISRIDPRKMRRIWPEIEQYFYEKNGRLHNKRIEKQIAYADEVSEKNRQNARKRWDATADAIAENDDDAIAMPPDPDPYISNTYSPIGDIDQAPQKSEIAPEDRLPDGLNRTAWHELTEYLHRAHTRQVHPTTMAKTIDRMLMLDHDQQQRAVDDAIASGWKTIYPERYLAHVAETSRPLSKMQRARAAMEEHFGSFEQDGGRVADADAGPTIAQFPLHRRSGPGG